MPKPSVNPPSPGSCPTMVAYGVTRLHVSVPCSPDAIILDREPRPLTSISMAPMLPNVSHSSSLCLAAPSHSRRRAIIFFFLIRRISPNHNIDEDSLAGTFLYWKFRKGRSLPAVSRRRVSRGFARVIRPPASRMIINRIERLVRFLQAEKSWEFVRRAMILGFVAGIRDVLNVQSQVNAAQRCPGQ